MNICQLPSDLRAKYPKMFIARFASTAIAGGARITDGIENKHDGYVEEFEKIGNIFDSPPAVEHSQLRPLSNLDELTQGGNAFLSEIYFSGYDSTLQGSAEQDSATNELIISSRSENDTYAQTPVRNGQIYNWQPNWFVPVIKVNGSILNRGLSTPFFSGNIADRSIGLPCPFSMPINEEYNREVTDIKVYAHLLQFVNGKYKRYPLTCNMVFWHK